MFYIKDTCVCCHNCEMECPVGAIQIGNHEKYEIDQEKCIRCGRCEEVCHTCSAVNSEAPKAEAHDKIVRECDVLVVGSGTGLIGAVRAAQQGKKVIVIEKQKKLGGNTDYAHAFFPVYSPFHAEAGLPNLREEAIEVFYERAGGQIPKEMFRASVEGCDGFFEWLMTYPETRKHYTFFPLGEVRAVGPFYTNGMVDFPKRISANLLCDDMAIGPGWGGTFIKEQMLRIIREEKLWVEIYTETAAEHLILNEKGEVTGVLCHDAGGEVEIHAGATVLATGGLGASDEKMQKYFGYFNSTNPSHRFSVPTDTGDAIDMLEEIGVPVDDNGMYYTHFGPAHHPFSYCIYRITNHPSTMYINLDGQRWKNEEIDFMDGEEEFYKQPGEVAWAIFDKAAIDKIADEYIHDPALAGERWIYEKYEEDFEKELKMKTFPVRKADSIEELAEKLFIPKDKVVETVKRYNHFCETGVDEDFGKSKENLRPIAEQGPYYAIRCKCFSDGAFGGVRVNEKCQITREDGSVIPGLYGVGDATNAMQRRNLRAVVSELTWATASSFICGSETVAYLKEKEGK